MKKWSAKLEAVSKPTEHKTVQARILAYAEAIGWTVVSREEAEQRRGFDPKVLPADRARNRSIFFDDLLDAKVREFDPCYAETEGALLGRFPPSPRLLRTSRHLHTDIHSNRAFRFSFIALCFPYDQDHHSS